MAKKYPRWEKNGEKCPRCKRETENRIVLDHVDGGGRQVEYIEAERCRHCGWTFRF